MIENYLRPIEELCGSLMDSQDVQSRWSCILNDLTTKGGHEVEHLRETHLEIHWVIHDSRQGGWVYVSLGTTIKVWQHAYLFHVSLLKCYVKDPKHVILKNQLSFRKTSPMFHIWWKSLTPKSSDWRTRRSPWWKSNGSVTDLKRQYGS